VLIIGNIQQQVLRPQLRFSTGIVLERSTTEILKQAEEQPFLIPVAILSDFLNFLPRFLRDRVREVPGLTNALEYPHAEFTTGRALRTSPIFPKLQLAGAQFGQVKGPAQGLSLQVVGSEK
jgi:hypothetical protein